MQIQLTEYFYFNLVVIICYLGFPGSSVVRNPPAMQETLVQFWVGKIPWRREWVPTPVFWPGEFNGLYSPLGFKEWDMAEQLLRYSIQSFNKR